MAPHTIVNLIEFCSTWNKKRLDINVIWCHIICIVDHPKYLNNVWVWACYFLLLLGHDTNIYKFIISATLSYLTLSVNSIRTKTYSFWQHLSLMLSALLVLVVIILLSCYSTTTSNRLTRVSLDLQQTVLHLFFQ